MRAASLPLLAATGLLLAPGVGDAGGTTGAGCNCTPPPPACCNIPTSHTVTVPGINVIPPSVYIAPPRLAGGVSGEGTFSSSFSGDISVSVQASASSSANASSSASALASAASSSAASAQGFGSALATANSQAANLLAASGSASASGSSFSEGSTSGNIPSLIVSTPGATTTRQVCVRTAASSQAVAIQAVCLDDKAVPHPASQAVPGQDVPETYAGELFRCIAGSHMQYVLAPYAGEARFDHGQTVVCQKGEALWRDLGGRLQCRPQTPARDCNERSLLRRYGAGIKILKAAVGAQCVEWRTESVQAEAASQGGLALDGGVGG